MPDTRKCCILGICCDPPEQRAALKHWISELVMGDGAQAKLYGTAEDHNSYLDAKLGDLFAGEPPK